MRSLLLCVALSLGLIGCKSTPPPPQSPAGERKLAEAKVPLKVHDAFNKDHPKVNITWINTKIKDNGDVHYEFKYTDADGRKGEAEYDSEGMKAIP